MCPDCCIASEYSKPGEVPAFLENVFQRCGPFPCPPCFWSSWQDEHFLMKNCSPDAGSAFANRTINDSLNSGWKSASEVFSSSAHKLDENSVKNSKTRMR